MHSTFLACGRLTHPPPCCLLACPSPNLQVARRISQLQDAPKAADKQALVTSSTKPAPMRPTTIRPRSAGAACADAPFAAAAALSQQQASSSGTQQQKSARQAAAAEAHDAAMAQAVQELIADTASHSHISTNSSSSSSVGMGIVAGLSFGRLDPLLAAGWFGWGGL
jgi:hypothetical protein